MLKRGVPFSAAEQTGETALHCAARKGHDACVKLLLESGFEAEAKSTVGKHSLHRLLLASYLHASAPDGASVPYPPFIAPARPCLARRTARRPSTLLPAREVSDAWSFCSANARESTAKTTCAAAHSVDSASLSPCLTALLRIAPYHTLFTPHHSASGRLFKPNLASHIHLHCPQDGRTPLHAAAASGHLSCALLLLERGANLNAKDSDLNAPLHVAAARGHVPCARLLLENGADTDMANKVRCVGLMRTPLRSLRSPQGPRTWDPPWPAAAPDLL